MGADLYLEPGYSNAEKKWRPMFEAAVKERDAASQRGDSAAAAKAQERVHEAYQGMAPEDGYFRDSYNDSSLFWTLGLSWWGGVMPDGTKLYNGKGCIPPKVAAKLADFVESAPYVKLPNPSVGESAEQVRAYFDDKKARFVRFLRLAAKSRRSIRASV